MKLAVFSVFDAQVKFREELQMSTIVATALDPHKMAQRHRENQTRVRWDRMRKEILSEIAYPDWKAEQYSRKVSY